MKMISHQKIFGFSLLVSVLGIVLNLSAFIEDWPLVINVFLIKYASILQFLDFNGTLNQFYRIIEYRNSDTEIVCNFIGLTTYICLLVAAVVYYVSKFKEYRLIVFFFFLSLVVNLSSFIGLITLFFPLFNGYITLPNFLVLFVKVSCASFTSISIVL